MTGAIPYTVERRPDTGVNNVMLGMWLFLASEVMLFGGLFSAYVLLRTSAEHWPRGAEVLDLGRGTINTVILVASSIAIAMARRAAGDGRTDRARALLGVTAFLALAFLGMKGTEYAAKLGHGIYPATSTFFAVYYLLTFVHALHVGGGLVANSYLAAAGARSTGGDSLRFANRIGAAALYWHFVDLVWVCIFVTLYL